MPQRPTAHPAPGARAGALAALRGRDQGRAPLEVVASLPVAPDAFAPALVRAAEAAQGRGRAR